MTIDDAIQGAAEKIVRNIERGIAKQVPNLAFTGSDILKDRVALTVKNHLSPLLAAKDKRIAELEGMLKAASEWDAEHIAGCPPRRSKNCFGECDNEQAAKCWIECWEKEAASCE